MQIVVQILVMLRLWKKPRRAPKASASFNLETVFQLQNFADRFGAYRASGEEMKMFIEVFPETGT
ncbi:hypothetical protein WN944_024503 [Citrus x changshan-huyou]|uniref:Uncharacterized protein n=1 Tax=Citrus x changshan-huyou TaxID=2935761 RepID=A0AAP0LNR2_9ROSI